MALYSRTEAAPDVAIVGGGIIGLAVAWRARQAGHAVTVFERGAVGQGASRVAAGMLAPVSEVDFGEGGRRVLELGLRSAAMWPDFAAELGERSGRDVGLERNGTLMVARDADEARELERQLAFRESLGLRASRLLPSEARAREPALAPTIRLAIEAPDDHSVDPRAAVAALRRACELDGVRIEEHVPVAGLAFTGERVDGLLAQDGVAVKAGCVVLAAGAWSGGLDGAVRAGVPVRPVKGQLLQLADAAGRRLLERTVRCEGAYLVPRADGRLVLGATVEERGFETDATAGGVYEMLRDAHDLLPGIAELHLREVAVGLRPGTPDNAPLIGVCGADGLLLATGHYRNGVLLAPLTGQLVAGVLAGDPPDPILGLCDPQRPALRAGETHVEATA